MIRVTSIPDAQKWRETAVLSPLQMIVLLLEEGFITSQEAIEASTNNLMPPSVQYAISILPPESQILAQITWAKMTVVERLHPIVVLLGEAFEVAEEEIDRMFREYDRSAM